jgi:hypothetical protein
MLHARIAAAELSGGASLSAAPRNIYLPAHSRAQNRPICVVIMLVEPILRRTKIGDLRHLRPTSPVTFCNRHSGPRIRIARENATCTHEHYVAV